MGLLKSENYSNLLSPGDRFLGGALVVCASLAFCLTSFFVF
jgi:hypothetical protein